ncbi:MAG: DUF3379 family protein [Rudaea sp.]
MNCVEFRRQLVVDPHASGAEFVRHRGECARCAAAAERALEFESALQRALAVEPPVQLVESVLLAQATAQRRRRSAVRRVALFALAASLALAVGVFGTRVEATPLSALAVAHVESEASVLRMVGAVSASEVGAAFAQRGVKLDHVPAGVSFVACCPMGPHATVHLMMPENDDPVTVIYVVDQRTAQRDDFVRDGWSGRVLPLGSGTLILLARHPLAFDRVEAIWRGAIASQMAR